MTPSALPLPLIDQPAVFLLVASFLAGLGAFACVVRRDAIGYVLGTELMLSAAALVAVTVGRFAPAGDAVLRLEMQSLALLLLVLAACEAAVVLALALAFARNTGSADLTATEDREP